MKTCDCGGKLTSYGGARMQCTVCGSIYEIITERSNQALIDACKLPEIQALYRSAVSWGIIALDEGYGTMDKYGEVLAPFEELIPEEKS